MSVGMPSFCYGACAYVCVVLVSMVRWCSCGVLSAILNGGWRALPLCWLLIGPAPTPTPCSVQPGSRCVEMHKCNTDDALMLYHCSIDDTLMSGHSSMSDGLGHHFHGYCQYCWEGLPQHFWEGCPGMALLNRFMAQQTSCWYLCNIDKVSKKDWTKGLTEKQVFLNIGAFSLVLKLLTWFCCSYIVTF